MIQESGTVYTKTWDEGELWGKGSGTDENLKQPNRLLHTVTS